MRITTQLKLISTFTLAAIVVLLPVLYWSNAEFKSAKNNYILADFILVNFFERASFRDQYFLYREDRVRAQWDANKEIADQLLSRAEVQFRDEEDRKKLLWLRRHIDDTAVIFHRIVNNSLALKSPTDDRYILQELDTRLSSQLLLKAAAVRDTVTALKEASAQRVEQTYQYLVISIGLFALTLALATIMTALHLGRLIRKRLAPLHAGAKIVAGGNLDFRINCDGSDEFAELALSINNMTDKLQAEIMANKQANEKISELNRDFVNFLEQTSDFIFFKDKNSRFRFCSQTLANVTGHASWRDMIGKHDLEVFPKDIARIYYEEELPIFREGKPLLGKIDTYYDAAGQQGWVSTSKWPLLDHDGSVVGLFGISRDITKRMQLEARLKTSEEKFRNIFDLVSDGIELISMDGCIVDMNQIGYERMGYTKDEMIGKKLADFGTPEYANRVPERMDLIKSQGFVRFESARIRKDGSVLPIEVSSRFVELGGQQLFLGISRDISERKFAESELRIAATAFEAQEGITVTDVTGRILRVNPAFTRITGYTQEEVEGKNPRVLKSGRHDENFYESMWGSIKSSGAWEGEIWNRRKNGEVYPEYLTITAVRDSKGIVTNYVATFNDITLSKASSEEIKNLAFNDPLTHLPNRRLLMDRLQQAFVSSARYAKIGALLFIDLDNFKTLNDTLGHDVGDLLLQQVAQRLESCVREKDTVARIGGDEFVVILEDLSAEPIEAATQTEAVGVKILASLNQNYQLGLHAYRNTPSIGATLFNGHEQTADELFKQADIAMYQAKKAGRNTLRFFDPQMQDTVNSRAALEADLRNALERRQFQLYFQIQMDDANHALGAEALIRWIHPDRGLVTPAQFIPLAEESGLILPIGQWVLESACVQLKSWQQNPHTRDLVLSVNVSAKQFHQIDFVSQVQVAAQRHAVNLTRLKLELTESMLLENVEDTIATMNALKELGVRFSLDDFGTGYSSLQYLKRLPLDQLKIDQSFVHDLTFDSSDQAIVRTVIAMAHSLNLDVIAEGVETEEQRIFLQDSGCRHFQGYLFGMPVPIKQFEALLKSNLSMQT